MENPMLRKPVDSSTGIGTTRFLVMRAVARLHECDEEAIYEGVDAARPEIRDLLRDMVSRNELEASPARLSTGKRKATFSLTLEGWSEYMKSLESIYELPE